MKEDIIRMAREAGLGFLFEDHLLVHDELQCFAALVAAAERNKLIAWMMAQGYTYDIERDKLNEWMGYTASQGDATKDLLTELGWQIEQRIKGLMSDMECQVAERVKAEREACAKLCETEMRDWYASQDKSAQSKIMLYTAVYDCAAAIRARGQA
jgi:hypothetical protein